VSIDSVTRSPLTSKMMSPGLNPARSPRTPPMHITDDDPFHLIKSEIAGNAFVDILNFQSCVEFALNFSVTLKLGDNLSSRD